MRQEVDDGRVRAFLNALARATSHATTVYLTVRQFDPYAQVLAKLERGFGQDLSDVRAMVDRHMVDPARLLELFDVIADELHRFPSVDADELRADVVDLGLKSG